MRSGTSWSGERVFTVGHSTRTLDQLVGLLRAFGVSVLADIRTIPRSRHNPQFNADELRASLRSCRLRYVHLPELGGLRRPQPDSSNTGWRNASFRGFADYMQTDGFEAGLAKLRGLAAKGRVAVMCAEAVPWRCHRSLVADALTARGAHVEHISSAKSATPHRLTSFAEINGTRVTYPGDDPQSGRLVTRAPFHLEATVRVLQRRPTNAVDVWREGAYQRVLGTPHGPALVEVTNEGTIDDPSVRFAVLRGDVAAGAPVAKILRRMLGLDLDPGPVQRRAEAEPRLRATARALRGMRPPRFGDLFEAFANVIPFQQLSLEAGVSIVRRIVEQFGASLEHAGRRFHAFPAAPAIAEARLPKLRACGLSLHKAEALRHAARAIQSGAVTEESLARMTTDDAVRFLIELPGVGRWSAQVILLRGLGRLDVFPSGDTGATRGLGELLRLAPGPALARAVGSFGDQRGYLYFCVLGGALLAKGLIHPAPSPRRGRPAVPPRAHFFGIDHATAHRARRNNRHDRGADRQPGARPGDVRDLRGNRRGNRASAAGPVGDDRRSGVGARGRPRRH